MKKEKSGWGLEAKALGADIKTIRESFRRIYPYKNVTLYYQNYLTAKDIIAVWDYRKVGLTVNEARKYIEKWTQPNNHPEPYIEPNNRIIKLGKIAKYVQDKHKLNIESLAHHKNIWYCGLFYWENGNNVIVTEKLCKHTKSAKVMYKSYLIDQNIPSINKLKMIILNECYLTLNQSVKIAAVKSVTHSLQGNWKKRVVDELGITPYKPDEIIRYKKVAYDPNEPGIYYSLYDHSKYYVGVERIDHVKKFHRGGLYCYKTKEIAKQADVKVCDESAKLPHKVVSVRVEGKFINYDYGKLAYSKMTILPDE